MSQLAPRVCMRCGNPLGVYERFCSNCGATADFVANNPTATPAGPDPRFYVQTTAPKDPTLVPPPPPDYVPPSSAQFPYTQYPSSGQTPAYYNTNPPVATPLPDYAATPMLVP